MVRVYKRSFTSCRKGNTFLPYVSYSKDALENAIREVQAGTLSVGMAAKKYQVPKSTVSRRYRNKNTTQETAGHPTLFSKDEEDSFLKFLLAVSEWGFPFDTIDLRVFAKKYLDKIGKKVYRLKDNMPGVDWALNFLKRHKSKISNRYAANISTDRAKVTEQTIDSFFEHYSETIEGVSPDCIINYDETNLTDDPGNKKFIYRRGTKYPERVVNSSKTAISLMFTGTADGQTLPIYVVYKSEHLWDQWIEGGPKNTRYGRSKSGWFDGIIFQDWFHNIIVPYAKTKEGKKIVLIGDNLSSYISFVCLPPKATHLLQPLDVAYYAPLKHYWRIILTDWKKKEGRKHKTLVKSTFPRLLTKLCDKLMENGAGSANLIAGFNKCGLYPINPDKPKSRLPQKAQDIDNNVASEVVMDMLQDIRGILEPTKVTKRKKKCVVPPGKSITSKDLEPEEVIVSATNTIQKGKGKGVGKKTKPKNRTEISTKENNKDKSGEIEQSAACKENRKPRNSVQTQHDTTNTDSHNDSLDPYITSCTVINPTAVVARKVLACSRSSSSTSVSDNMSIHSDSDLLDNNFDDIYDSDKESVSSTVIDLTNIPGHTCNDWDMAGPSKSFYPKEKPPTSTSTSCKPTNLSETDAESDSNAEHVEIPSNTENMEIDKPCCIKDTVLPHMTETDPNGDDVETPCNTDMDKDEPYCVGDTVLVRYWFHMHWKYFAGVIENIESQMFDVKFYRTVTKPELKFKFPKRVDRDTALPSVSIVKKLRLQEKADEKGAFILLDDENTIYF